MIPSQFLRNSPSMACNSPQITLGEINCWILVLPHQEGNLVVDGYSCCTEVGRRKDVCPMVLDGLKMIDECIIALMQNGCERLVG